MLLFEMQALLLGLFGRNVRRWRPDGDCPARHVKAAVRSNTQGGTVRQGDITFGYRNNDGRMERYWGRWGGWHYWGALPSGRA